MVALDGDCLISVLIDGPGPVGTARAVPPFCVRQREPVHESWQLVGPGPEYQMPMIRHHAISEKPGGYACERFGDQIFKRAVVAVIEENAYTPHGAIQDVKNQASGYVQRSLRHGQARGTSNSDAQPGTVEPPAE